MIANNMITHNIQYGGFIIPLSISFFFLIIITIIVICLFTTNSSVCNETPWTNDGDCSLKCGRGILQQKRTAKITSSDGQISCKVLTESIPCNVQPCPQDCVVSDWTMGTTCSKECGGGEKTRTRTIIKEPKENGKPCPNLFETISCNTQPCISLTNL